MSTAKNQIFTEINQLLYSKLFVYLIFPSIFDFN